MVKLKGPVLSVAAGGTIGKTATYANWKGRAYLKFKPTPAQPRSGLQVSMRAMMTFLTKQWKQLTDNQQATWANAYPDPQLNNYNAFLRHNLERWRNRRTPSKAYPAAEEGQESASQNINATGGTRHVTLDVNSAGPIRDTWTFLLFHSAIASPDADVDKLIHIFKIEDSDHHFWTHSPLAAGTHYYRIIPTMDDGSVAWFIDRTDSAVVT